MTFSQKFVPYKGSSDYQWHEIPLGVDPLDQVQTLDVLKTPVTLLAGHTGTGKSVIQRTMLAHAIQHPDALDFYGIDFEGFEMTPYTDVPGVKKIATTLEEAVDMLLDIKKRKTNPNRLEKPVLLVIDEITLMLTRSSYPPERFLEESRENDLKEKAEELLTWMASEGRTVGIYTVLGTHSPNSNAIQGSLRKALQKESVCGILVGHLIETFDTERVQGRGYIQKDGTGFNAQFFYSSHEWVEGFVAGSRHQEKESRPTKRKE